MFNDIVIERDGRVGTIRINRANFSNAFAYTTYSEIKLSIDQLEADDGIGAIVITGAGKHFSAGGDIKRFKEIIDSKEYLSEENMAYTTQMTKAIKYCAKPTIAMVNGVATGAGFSLALACDFRAVSEKTKLIMGFISMGLPGDTGSIYFLTKLIGVERASKMMMSGEPVTGRQAMDIGLATLYAEAEDFEKATYVFAANLANKPTSVIAKQKALLNKYFYSDLPQYYEDETSLMAEASRESAFATAVNAYLVGENPLFNK